MLWLLRLQRLVPVAGLLLNRLFHPRLSTGLKVEILCAGEIVVRGRAKVGEGTRIELLPQSKLELGDAVVTGRNLYLRLDRGNVQCIGERTSIQDNCRLYGNVRIGKGCIFGPNVYLSSGDHVFDAHSDLPIIEQERLSSAVDRPIVVLDDCWFGINVFVRAGVTIGRGCVIGANSVVTHDVPPYSIVAGAPARVLRRRFDFDPPPRISAESIEAAPYFYDGFPLLKRPGRADRVVNGDFTLALSKPAAKQLSICAQGDGVEIEWGAQTRALQGREVLHFDLPETPSSPFLQLKSSAECSILWAELR